MFVITALRSVYGRTNYQRLLVRPIFDLFFIFDNINRILNIVFTPNPVTHNKYVNVLYQ